ncbi:MAG: hypothetical protein WC465_01865 [Patescibacteria group bacterium]
MRYFRTLLIAVVVLVCSVRMTAADAYVPVITMPDTIYGLVGRPVDIHYDQLSAQVPAAASIVYSCLADSGSFYDWGYSFTAHAPTVITCTIVAKDSTDVAVASATTHIRVVTDTAQGQPSLLTVGDSLVEAHPAALDSAYIVTAIKVDFEESGGAQVKLLGTNGLAPGVHEGYSGKCWVNFTSPSTAYFTNPFWNVQDGKIDFQYYTNVSGQAGPIGYCIVQLGYNGIYALLGAELTPSIMALWFQRIDGFCSALLSADRGYPNCRVVISLPSSGNISQAAWVDNYGSLDNWEAFEKNMAIYRAALVSHYDKGIFHPNVSLCASGLFVDRINGYPANNYLHPNKSAYVQMAGAFYAHLRALQAEQSLTGVVEASSGHPTLMSYPNPCNPRATIRFNLPKAGHIRLGIFDVRGCLVTRLADDLYVSGWHTVHWTSCDLAGRNLASGAYFARLETGGTVATARLSIVR